MLVKLWMTQKVITVTPVQSIAEAEQVLLTNKLRRIPVVDGEQLVGIVCDTDIVKAKPSVLDPADQLAVDERCEFIQVQQVMTGNPVTIAPDAPIEEAALKMRRHKIHSIPVIEQGRLVGIITETNIFNAFLKILGVEAHGMRIELLIEHNSNHFYQLLDIFKEQNVAILAITVYPDFSREHQLVTVKTSSNNKDAILDALWQAGMKINSVY